MLEFVTTNATDAGPLTEEDFFAAMRAAYRQMMAPRPPPCLPHEIVPGRPVRNCALCGRAGSI